MAEDLSAFARILFECTYHSRRQAKRLIREAGGKGSSGELNTLLRAIEEHPRAADIYAQAEELHAAEEAARQERLRNRDEGANPAWLFCENCDGSRHFVFHLCPGGAWSFLGEVFDSLEGRDPEPHELAARDLEQYPLADGQWLGNILWLDGEPPPMADRRELMRECREQLAAYDANLNL